MKRVQLKGKSRKVSNKQAVKTLRRDGHVPCILYGQGVENVLFSVSARDLNQIIFTPNSYIIDIEIDGKSYVAVFHDAQYHPVSDEPLHLDFLAVSEDKPIAINVPLVFSGNSEGVRQGGKFSILLRKLKISALMKDLPDNLEIDITNMKIGKTITVENLKFDNIKILHPAKSIICAVKTTRAVAGGAEASADASAETEVEEAK